MKASTRRDGRLGAGSIDARQDVGGGLGGGTGYTSPTTLGCEKTKSYITPELLREECTCEVFSVKHWRVCCMRGLTRRFNDDLPTEESIRKDFMLGPDEEFYGPGILDMGALTDGTNKKDLSRVCTCAIKSPIHTVGYHEAILKAQK